MKKAIKVKWFKGCSSVEQAKKLWLKLAMRHHPDHNGDLTTMQEINAEWDYVKANPWVLSTVHKQERKSYPWEDTQSYTYKKQSEQSQRQKVRWEDFDLTPSPGKYTVEIIDVIDNEEKSYIALVFDISNTKCKGYFKHERLYKHCIYLKYDKEWQKRNTLKIVHIINASNQGFDGVKCLSGSNIYEFVGKRLGVKLSREFIDGKGFINYEDVFAV